MKIIHLIKKLLKKRAEFRKAGCNVFIVALRFLYYYLFFGKRIIEHQRTTIKGVSNIKMSKGSSLEIGTHYRGILKKSDETLINVQGILNINGKVSIDRGVILDVNEGGVLNLGNKVQINSFTKIICAEKIVIGERTAISWECQLMDTDFHQVKCLGVTKKTSPIIIGKHVWIGCDVHIYKGIEIADESVIGSRITLRANVPTKKSLVMAIPDIKILPGVVNGWGEDYLP
jgi:acetyltransferase-like isoleucine patch superfamily enzyme